MVGVRRQSNASGFALPAALLAVLLIAALIAGAFAAVTEETAMPLQRLTAARPSAVPSRLSDSSSRDIRIAARFDRRR